MKDVTLFIERHKAGILRVLAKARDDQRLTNYADRCGLPVTRFSGFLNGKRDISPQYLMKMFEGGIIRMSDLVREGDVQGLSQRDKEIYCWLKLAEDRETLELFTECQTKGIDLKFVLRGFLGRK